MVFFYVSLLLEANLTPVKNESFGNNGKFKVMLTCIVPEKMNK